MPYTDNFRGTNIDSRPEQEFPVEVKAVENAQMLYREIIEAIILLCRRRGYVCYPRNRKVKNGNPSIDRMSFFELASFIENHIKEEMSRLSAAGYECIVEGEDHEEFFDRMHALLKGEPLQPLLSGDNLANSLPNPYMEGFSVQRALRQAETIMDFPHEQDVDDKI